MSKHNNSRRFTARDRHDFGANGQRADGNPSAKELIAHAVAARTDTVFPAEGTRVAYEHAKKPRHGFTKRGNAAAGKKTLAGDLPTMRELEQARTDHSRKIASREAERRAEEPDEKAAE